MDLEDYDLYDQGDLDFPFGNKDRVIEMLYNETKSLLAHNKIPLMIGGEHLVTYPVAKAIVEKYPEVVFLHFDAHADLRTDYMEEKLSHATVMNLVHGLVGDDRIYQFGIRSGTKEEFEFAKNHTVMEKFTVTTLDNVIKQIKDKPVYVTIDLDVLDPSIFPGTGTPEPGGIDFMTLQKSILKMKELNIVGGDVVELSPQYDASGVSTAVACKVVRELTLAILA
jgi:agmatinase